MNLRYVVGAICLGALALGANPAAANDATAGSDARVGHETGYVTTQARRGRGGGGGGSFNRGGRGPVVVAPRRRNNTGRNVAIGVGAAILGGIIASEAARANSRSSGGDYRGGNSCRRWAFQCDDGSRWACRNLDRYC